MTICKSVIQEGETDARRWRAYAQRETASRIEGESRTENHHQTSGATETKREVQEREVCEREVVVNLRN